MIRLKKQGDGVCVFVRVCFAFVCVCVSIHLNVIYDKQ